MWRAVYVEDNGLYQNLIIIILNAAELKRFCNELPQIKVLEFSRIDYESVAIREESSGENVNRIYLSDAEREKMHEAIDKLFNFFGPAHDYIDVDGGYVLMISKDEYK